jgi:hypothetical protein
MGDEDDEPLNLMDSVKVTTGVTWKRAQAQDFVGTNNLNLFEPLGAMGSGHVTNRTKPVGRFFQGNRLNSSQTSTIYDNLW